LLEECMPIATALDAIAGGSAHRDALAAARSAWREPETLPSARVLDTMVRDGDGSYIRVGRMQSQHARNALMKLPYPAAVEARFRQLAEESLREQQRIEAADTMPFESFRRDYLSSKQLVV